MKHINSDEKKNIDMKEIRQSLYQIVWRIVNYVYNNIVTIENDKI